MKRFLLIALASALFALVAVCTAFAATGTATATYTEPTTNSDGTALTNLGKTTVYCQVPPATTGTACGTVPASKASGGGAISTQVSVTVPDNANTTVTYWATATNTNNIEGAKSNAATKPFNLLPPGTIPNFQVQ